MSQSILRGTAITALACIAWGCGSSDDESTSKKQTEPVRLTTEVTWTPSIAPKSPADSRKPYDPADRDAMLADGFGELVEGAGEPYGTLAPPGETPPAAGSGAKRLVRFVHMPDFQLPDDESPTRLALFDTSGLTSGAFRPQEAHLCRMVNAAVKSVNELHATDPIDFVLLGGDNADSAQENEVDWVMQLLSGQDGVDCDSGTDDDPVAGANNDPKDPFDAPGLAMRWYWVTGNHDILVQGNLPITTGRQSESIGSNCIGGARDWTQAGSPLVKGEVVADERRKAMMRADLMQRIKSHGDGHGIGDEQVTSGKAIYTFDVDGTPLRFLILDTAAETGGSEGLIRQGDVDSVIKPALDKAKSESKYVILASHHATNSIKDGTGLGGEAQPDAVTEQAWLDTVGAYPNVVFSMVGHSHRNRVKLTAPSTGHAWWEVMTSALADFPHQIRVLEIWDQDNGWLMLRATNVDWSPMGDPLATEGRTLGVMDYVAGWSAADGPGELEDRNVEVWIKKP